MTKATNVMNATDSSIELGRDVELNQRLKKVVWIVTILVWVLVLLMRSPYKIPLPAGIELSVLPAVNAILNSIVACLLIAALVFVKRGNIEMHRNAISSAMILSGCFLLCYVVYHFTHSETKFGGVGFVRYIYFGVLISHIILAAVSFPFILMAWVHGFTQQVDQHKRLTRWVFPIWLYVAITGPICYLMLRPYY